VADSRALIRNYRESEWRSTRFEAIQGLGQFSDGRSFQFLVGVIENNKDLAEQQLALVSLSLRRDRAASLFIKKYRKQCPDTLRATVAYAIGQAQIYDLGTTLLEDFETALSRQDDQWLKNLILALGELKEFRAVPLLHRLLMNRLSSETDLILSAFLALGRLERDADSMAAYSAKAASESLLNQVYQSAVSQIQIRSQFKLEDYLTKIFELPKPHPALPLELKGFDEDEVKIGLSLFAMEHYWERYLFAFRGLSQSLRIELLPQILMSAPEPAHFFEEASKSLAGLDTVGLAPVVTSAYAESLRNEVLDLRFCDVFSEEIDFFKKAETFFKQGSSSEGQVQFLNLWHDTSLSRDRNNVKKEFAHFAQNPGLKPEAYGRLVRAAAEQGLEIPEITSALAQRFSQPELRASLLLYAERFALPKSLDLLQARSASEIEEMGARVLPLLESLAEQKRIDAHRKFLLSCLKIFENSFNVDFLVGVLRVIRFTGFTEFEKFSIEKTKHQNPLVELNAIIALKSYPTSRDASIALTEKLESQHSAVTRGRALDALCANTTLLAKRGVMEYLERSLHDEEVIDKIYRSFDPEQKGGEEFVKSIERILKQNPDHPQWEKLLRLKDRLGQSTVMEQQGSTALSTPEVQALDLRLKTLIPKFESLDATTKLALRAAEQPFSSVRAAAEVSIDKAPAVLEYCKALDLILEKTLGQKHLFPRLDLELHDFQTLWHRVGFGEDYPQLDRVMNLLGLKGKVSPEQFPLHKAKMMCGTFFNGKILQDRFKIFDGLRAWAVIFFVFARKIHLTSGTVGPMLKLQGLSEDQVITMAKKLMALQDLRNPAAHRQTYTDLSMVENVRAEAAQLINLILA